MARVLVVDDDHTVREVVVSYLRAARHQVAEAADGMAALVSMRESPADLVVLDLMLPGIDGLEVCRRLREHSDVPVIMLTALGSETDRVVGLERGADDYVTKPFSPRELVLRVDSVLRRLGERATGADASVTDGDLVVDPARHVATLAGRALSLTVREFDLLRFLVAQRRHRPLPRPAAVRGVGLVVRGRLHRDRARAPAAREGRGRPDPAGAAGHRVGRRLPVGAGAVSDRLAVVLIAASWSGAVGLLGLAAAWWLRRTSLRWLPAGVALVAVAAVVAGVVGTSRAMFLSGHDFEVVLLVLLVAGAVAFVLALLVGTTVVRASASLREDARLFGESGRFVSRGGGPAEFQQLSDELTRTSARLADSRAREVRLEESRRELVSWVSHDLRTPLAGLRAMTEALEDGLATTRRRYHAQMRAEVDRMVRMVDDLFELSRIHAGLVTPVVRTVALGDLVSEALAAAAPVARARQVRLGGSVPRGCWSAPTRPGCRGCWETS